jgi:hypothetical protein
MGVARTAQDKKWEAESDAHTLAEAETIKSDKGRTSRAKNAAGRMAKEQQVRANAMTKVAGKPTVRSNTKIPGVKKRK